MARPPGWLPPVVVGPTTTSVGDLHYTEYDTRLGAYGFIVRDQYLLLVLWNEPTPSLWTLPGGGVDFDETPTTGAVREIREETGYDVELTRILGVDTQTTPGPLRLPEPSDRYLKIVRTVYEARVVGGDLAIEEDGTTEAAQWVPLDQVETLPRIQLVDAALAMWRRDGRLEA